MKTEKIILFFIATLFGLLVAGIAFYLVQATKTIPDTGKTISFTSPTPTSTPSISLVLNQPKDEDVVSNKMLIVSGKTQSNAIIIIIINSLEDVVTPSANGTFSTTVNLSEGQNILEAISIAPNGESVRVKKTITYSEEEF